jgi:hypothetical protein
VAGKQQVIQLSESGDADLCPAGSSRGPTFGFAFLLQPQSGKYGNGVVPIPSINLASETKKPSEPF